MIQLSDRMVKAANSPIVPTDLWIEVHDIRFKSLLMKGDSKDIIEEAINTLKKICFILPPLPVDGLWYIGDAQEEAEEIRKKQLEQLANKNTTEEGTKETVDPKDLSSSSPEKSPTKRGLQKSLTVSSGYFLSMRDGKSHQPKSKEMMLNNIRKHLRGSSKDFNSRGSHDNRLKAQKSHKKSEESKTPDDNSSSEASNYDEYDNYLRVTFKSNFLYQIGKVSAKSGYMLEKALKYLNDFLLIINFYKQDMDTKSYSTLRAHAIYYIGIAYFQLGDKELSEKILRDIHSELVDIHGKDGKKVQKVDSILATYFTERFNPMTQYIKDYF